MADEERNDARMKIAGELIRMIESENFELPVKKVIVFGSIANNKVDSDSDIDLAVIIDARWCECRNPILDRISDRLYEISIPLAEKYYPGVKISPFHFTLIPRDYFENFGRELSALVNKIWQEGIEI